MHIWKLLFWDIPNAKILIAKGLWALWSSCLSACTCFWPGTCVHLYLLPPSCIYSKHCGPTRVLRKVLSSFSCQAIIPLLLFGSLPRATACFILQPLVPSVPLSQTACVELGKGYGLETTSNKTLESLAQNSWSRFNFHKFSLKSVLSLYCFKWFPMQYRPKDLVINFCSFLQPYLQLPLGNQILFLSGDWLYKGWIHSTLRESRKESFVPYKCLTELGW